MLVTFLIIVVKGIMRMKILLVPLNHYCKRYHKNENIACSFFIVTNFEIWVYKGMIIHFLLLT